MEWFNRTMTEQANTPAQRSGLTKDLTASFVVFMVALPLSMGIALHKLCCRGLVVLVAVILVALPGPAKATLIAPIVEVWETEFDKVGCGGGTICTWENTFFVTANIDPNFYNYDYTDVFVLADLKDPNTEFVKQVSFNLFENGTDEIGYFQFSGSELVTHTAAISSQLGQWTLEGVVCIGSIADGYCEFPSQPQVETFKVPEPTTLSLFAIGLAGLGVVSRRRKKRAVTA